jgi:hypothetical protein
VRVRQFELRLLAVGVTLLWAVGGGMVLLAYRPGGPVDVLVGIAGLLPLAVSLCSVLWPPLVRSGRGAAGIFWLGFASGLLLIPSIAGLGGQILSGGTQPLLPSLEVVYPWALSLLATSLFAGLGISRQLIAEVGIGRKRLSAAVAFSLVTTTAIAGLFGGLSVADAAALQDKPLANSRYGPTSPNLIPPLCSGAISVGSTARVDMDMWGDVDSKSVGTVNLTGIRNGVDFSWTAQLVRTEVFGEYGAVHLQGQSWTRSPGSGWQSTSDPLTSDQLDATVAANALSLENRATAEDRGLEYVEGAKGRHCRVAMDGPTFAASFPQIVWLSGDASAATWRGQMDYWVFGDGQLGRIEARINGTAQNIMPHGLLATFDVRMTATDRGRPVSISAP